MQGKERQLGKTRHLGKATHLGKDKGNALI
jgi:hypothetical protein